MQTREIYECDFFIFVTPERETINVAITKNGETIQEMVHPDHPRVFPRISRTIKIDDKTWSPAISIRSLPLSLCTSDKVVYKGGEQAKIFLYLARRGNQEVSLKIYHLGQPLFTKKIMLDNSGSAIYSLEDLENGYYKVDLESEGNICESCAFTVAPFTLSPLQVFIQKQVVLRGAVNIIAQVVSLNTPHSGDIRVDIKCGFCHGKVVETRNLPVENGIIHFEYKMAGHTGPFTLDFVTPDGSTATHLLEGTRAEERAELDLNKVGVTSKCSILSHEGASKAQNLFVWDTGSCHWPLAVEKTIDAQVEFKVLEDLAAVSCLQINPIDPVSPLVHDFHDVKRGDVISFPNRPPYSIVRCGFITKSMKAYQGSFTVIFPNRIHPKVKAPKSAKPGGEIQIELEVASELSPRDPIKCFLIVMDSRIERNEDDIRVGRQLFHHLMSQQAGWQNCELHSIHANELESEEKLNTETFRFAFFMDRLSERRRGIMSNFQTPFSPTIPFSNQQKPERPVMRVAAMESLEMQVDAWLRQEESVVLVESLDMVPNRPVTRSLILGEQVCTWRVEAIFCRGTDIVLVKEHVEASLDNFCEIFAPNYLEPGDQCRARINYKCDGDGTLRVETYHYQKEFAVHGMGVVQADLTGPTEIIAELVRDGQTLDRTTKRVEKIGTERVTVSQLLSGKAGDVFAGDQVVVYPSAGVLLHEGAMALVQYPHGCAEQTSAKVAGLISVWKAGAEGVLGLSPGQLQDVKDKLLAGVNRMNLFYRGEGRGCSFSLWENGAPTPQITAKVLKNLRKLRDLDLEEVRPLKERLTRAADWLMAGNFKDPALIEYNAEFGTGDLLSTEDAAHYLLAPHSPHQGRALRYLRDHAMEDAEHVSWKAHDSWAGILETTCLALTALAHRGASSSYLEKGLRFVGKRLIKGRLYSTSDTLALLDLFWEMHNVDTYKTNVEQRVIVADGREKILEKETILCKKVELRSPALVRVDTRTMVDYTRASSAFLFDVDVKDPILKLGERTQVTITLKEDSLCPIAHVFLPGNAVALEAGASLQVIVQPLKQKSLCLDILGIRPGTCWMRVLLRDMYDEYKIGCTAPIKLQVLD